MDFELEIEHSAEREFRNCGNLATIRGRLEEIRLRKRSSSFKKRSTQIMDLVQATYWRLPGP